jgi:hypothetical protein
MYMNSTFMVTAAAGGEPRPLYEDLYTIGGHDEDTFSLRGWQHNLRIGPPPSS